MGFALEQGIATTAGSSVPVTSAELEGMQAQLRGRLLSPADAEYAVARKIWNGMVERRPALIARCEGAADVMAVVAFARERSILVSVRGGGHNIAGNALCNGGLVIDLSAMSGVNVEPEAGLAHVGPGATLAQVDHETQAFGLATPLGINSTTGIAGLTLGGGFGWLSRSLGLTADNLAAADVVTAEGRPVHASPDENADLFWGLRGGGGNFGVVTRFTFRLHPIGTTVTAGLLVFGLEQGAEVLAAHRELSAQLDDETALWVVMRRAPPLPFLPAAEHGRGAVILALCSRRPEGELAPLLERLRPVGRLMGEHVGTMPYVAWQRAFDPLLTPGARNYWKSHNLRELDPGLAPVMLDLAGRLPSPQCEVFIGQLGGAVNRVSPDATAYAHRDVGYIINVHGRWERPEEDAAGVAWAREVFTAAAPFADGGVYVNFMSDDETGADRVRQAYGRNYDRLVKLKDRYDPTNLFCQNQNIRPTAALATEADVVTRGPGQPGGGRDRERPTQGG
jgi:FAD/FMN-containing dehydrogenase